MNMADRIQHLRKGKGISQEELADKIGVSRQAVSKWESEQSVPDIEKIVLLSEIFNVTTDYLIKGIEPVPDKVQKEKEMLSNVLYISSTALIFIGLFCAFAEWHEKQTMGSIWGSMIIQAVGIAGYFIGKLFSGADAPYCMKWINMIGAAFMPVSMVSGYLSILFFQQGWFSPYPIGLCHTLVFVGLFFAMILISFLFFNKTGKR